jgi:poly(3-hydroxybutyrate) depolymerase
MQHGAANASKGAMHHARSKFQAYPLMPAILIHGQHDRIVRPVNLAQLTEQFRELHHLSGQDNQALAVKAGGKPVGTKTSNAYHTCEYSLGGKPILKTCEILNLKHAWSGGDCTVRFNECKGPDASKLMWSFFAKHRRRPETGTRPAVCKG